MKQTSERKLAAIEAVEGRPRKAIEIAAAAENYAEQEGVVIEFGANNHGKVYLDNAKKELSVTDIEMAEKSGSSLSLKEVIEMGENEAELIG